jgi:hypothetical protein
LPQNKPILVKPNGHNGQTAAAMLRADSRGIRPKQYKSAPLAAFDGFD